MSLCENFLGCRPHWGLFKHIFTFRSQTVKKANPNDERTQVIQMRSKSAFPAMTLPESVRGWQSTWFYCQDRSTPGQSTGLPPFTMSRVNKPSSLKVIPEEKAQVKMLMERVVQLIRDGVTGTWIFWRFSFDGASSHSNTKATRCGCTLVLKTPLGSTQKKSTMSHWRDG